MQIEHDPKEPSRNAGQMWTYIGLAFAMAFIWTVALTLMSLDWFSLVLGAFTGGLFVNVMTEITGNKIPRWMRR